MMNPSGLGLKIMFWQGPVGSEKCKLVFSSQRAPRINLTVNVWQKGIWYWALHECLTQAKTGRVTVDRNITSASASWSGLTEHFYVAHKEEYSLPCYMCNQFPRQRRNKHTHTYIHKYTVALIPQANYTD
jgi:hypothetical protein